MLEERARIARELHDVVAHHMSMIAVQAETAPYRLAAKPGAAEAPGLPEPVSEEFAALGQAASEALIEMRRLLGVLRTPDNSKKRDSATTAGRAQPAPVAPQAAPRRHPGTRRRRPPRGRRGHPPDARSRREAAGQRRADRLPDRAGVAVQRRTACPGRADQRDGGRVATVRSDQCDERAAGDRSAGRGRNRRPGSPRNGQTGTASPACASGSRCSAGSCGPVPSPTAALPSAPSSR